MRFTKRLMFLLVVALTAGCTSPAVSPSSTTDSPSSQRQAPTTSMMAIPTQQSSLTPTSTEVLLYTTQEQTRYEGILEYTCDRDGCWRVGGTLTHPPEYYYPDIEADNPDIQALLADIGLPDTPAADDGEAWKRTVELWAWLYGNAQDPESSPEAHHYLNSLSYDLKPAQFPSIDDFAKVYARYQIIPWGTCTSRALTFATLLYRCGIDPNRMAAAYFKTADMSIQHFYVVVRSGDHWYYLDPTCDEPDWTPALPYEPANIGCVPEVDYEHPFTLAVIPGSTLTRAMLVI